MLPVSPRRVFFRARLGRAALVVALSLSTVDGPANRLGAEGLVPLVQLLAEAEQAMRSERALDAANVIERVIAEVGRGATLPSGVTWEQVLVAAASAAFRGGDFVRAEGWARQLVSPTTGATALAEARLVLGLALAQQKRFVEAVPVFAALAEVPSWRDQALLYLALAAESAGQPEVAIGAYGRLLAGAPRDAEWADAGLTVAALHLTRDDAGAALAVVRQLGDSEGVVENQIALDALRLEVAERIIADGDPEAAVSVLALVRSREALLVLQRERVARLGAALEAMVGWRASVADTDLVKRRRLRLERLRMALGELERAEDYDATTGLRRGRGLYASGDLWAAALVLARVAQRSPAAAAAEAAERLLVQAYAEAGRHERARAVLAAMWERRGDAESVAQATYALVQACQAQGRVADVVEVAALGLERFPRTPVREALLVLRANGLFALGRFEEARIEAERALADYPAGKLTEDACYLRCMTGLVLGEHSRALVDLADYLARYPDGRYGDDAAYRVAVAQFGRQAHAEAEQQARGWLTTRPVEHPQRGEVMSLLGDILAARSRPDEALVAYREALTLGLADEQLGYVLDEATKLYQTRGDSEGAAEMWESFVETHPSHPFVANAAYWIGRLLTRAGRPAEAIARMAAVARPRLDDPVNEGMERLLSELARLLVGTGDAEIELRVADLLFGGRPAGSTTAEARRWFLLAQRAAAKRRAEEEGGWLDRILGLEAPEALPPALLGRLGDRLRERGADGEARRYYEHLLRVYPRSAYADVGYVGLGELALASGESARALTAFDAAIDRAGARNRLLEATMGRGRALVALGRLDEAEAVFRQVVATKEWRGEATVTSLLQLGEIMAKRGERDDLAQAQAHFQRVYLTYRKFTPQVGRAYVRSAEVFEQLGQRSEAAATYRELLRDEKLAALPEATVARARLVRLEVQEP